MKMILVGASGTGKTTMLNQFKNIKKISEVARSIKEKYGVSLNEGGGVKTQELIFNEYLRLFSENESFVSDRGLFDVISYTRANAQISKDDEERKKDLNALYIKQRKVLRDFIKKNPDILYVFVPIEFPTVDDGIRSTSEEYRKLTQDLMLYHLETCKVNYLRVSGNLGERMKQIYEYILRNTPEEDSAEEVVDTEPKVKFD